MAVLLCHMAQDVTAPQTEEIIDALGGTAVFKRRPKSAEDFREVLHSGLPYRSILALTDTYGFPLGRISQILHVAPRTLARRKSGHRFTPPESDRLARVARVCAHAAKVFGTPAKASTWLTHPNRALQGKVPLDLLATDIGTREVETIMGRIEHGVMS